MNSNILVFICLILFEQTIQSFNTGSKVLLLPMKKDHKYGDDICYYRDNYDEKHYYTVYYVKPCEKGKFCEDEISGQPFGFCRDIPTNSTDFPNYGGACNSNGECPALLDCDGTCKLKCPNNEFPLNDDLSSFTCQPSGFKTTDDGTHCFLYEPKYKTTGAKEYDSSISETTTGKYPGLPKECGIIRYTSITDYKNYLESDETNYQSYTRWIKKSEDWATIGEAEDGVFVDNWRFCKSGFALKFYPKGDLVNPSVYDNSGNLVYRETTKEMCVTPIQIDYNNPEVEGPIVTYKINGGNEQKYNYYKYYPSASTLDEEAVIKSQLYTEFIEEFNNASEEDKKNCYKIPQIPETSSDTVNIAGNCQNIKLLKLYYFYTHIKEYLFYKDRKDLEKVLHFKIQQIHHRYYDISNYMNVNCLFLLLFLILF